MPWPIPTLVTLLDQGRQDINAAEIGADGLLDESVIGTLSDEIAGFSYGHYSFQAFTALQSNPWTATDEYADGWGDLKGVNRKPATPAIAAASFSGGVAVTLPGGTGIARQDGVAYVTTADAVSNGAGVVTTTIQAVAPGSAGNLAAGTQLTLTGSVPGITANSGVAGATVTPGEDLETDDAYKTRYLQAYRQPPQGGDLADYANWAEAATGVSRAWVAPNGMGAGTVLVYIMLDSAEALYAGFPQGTNGVATAETRDVVATGDQLSVANTLFPKQSVTALVYACAPAPAPQAFTITGVANTTANQTAIKAALDAMFLAQGNVGGTLNPDTNAAWPAIDPSAWYAAIAAALGSNAFGVSAPVAAIVAANGTLPITGTITLPG